MWINASAIISSEIESDPSIPWFCDTKNANQVDLYQLLNVSDCYFKILRNEGLQIYNLSLFWTNLAHRKIIKLAQRFGNENVILIGQFQNIYWFFLLNQDLMVWVKLKF